MSDAITSALSSQMVAVQGAAMALKAANMQGDAIMQLVQSVLTPEGVGQNIDISA